MLAVQLVELVLEDLQLVDWQAFGPQVELQLAQEYPGVNE